MLGAFGGRDKNKGTTSLQVCESAVIDAGNLLSPLGRSARKINHVFLSHCHMDHLVDLPFLIDAFFAERTQPLNVYGLPHTLEMLKKHIFNGSIWPDFNAITLLNARERAVSLHELKPGKHYVVDGVQLTPFSTNHTVPSIGYLVDKQRGKLLFTSDTGACKEIWQLLNNDEAIRSLIIETSFPSKMEQLAIASGHLTPKLLNEELGNLQRDDVKIYINHFKPDFIVALKEELASFPRTRSAIMLDDGVEIEL